MEEDTRLSPNTILVSRHPFSTIFSYNLESEEVAELNDTNDSLGIVNIFTSGVVIGSRIVCDYVY